MGEQIGHNPGDVEQPTIRPFLGGVVYGSYQLYFKDQDNRRSPIINNHFVHPDTDVSASINPLTGEIIILKNPDPNNPPKYSDGSLIDPTHAVAMTLAELRKIEGSQQYHVNL